MTLHPRLEELRTLERDWDSYDADPISETALVKAQEILTRATREPYFIAPIASGGVQLEWRQGHTALMVEVEPDGALNTLLAEPKYDERNGVTDADVNVLLSRVGVPIRSHVRVVRQ